MSAQPTQRPQTWTEFAEACRKVIGKRPLRPEETKRLEEAVGRWSEEVTVSTQSINKEIRDFTRFVGEVAAEIRSEQVRHKLFRDFVLLQMRVDNWDGKTGDQSRLIQETKVALQNARIFYADTPLQKMKALSLFTKDTYDPNHAAYLLAMTPQSENLENLIGTLIKNEAQGIAASVNGRSYRPTPAGFDVAHEYLAQVKNNTLQPKAEREALTYRVLSNIVNEVETVAAKHPQREVARRLAAQLYRVVYPQMAHEIPETLKPVVDRIFQSPVIGREFLSHALEQDAQRNQITSLTLYSLMHVGTRPTEKGAAAPSPEERRLENFNLMLFGQLALKAALKERDPGLVAYAVEGFRFIPPRLVPEANETLRQTWFSRPEVREQIVKTAAKWIGNRKFNVDSRNNMWRQPFLENDAKLMQTAWQALKNEPELNVPIFQLRDEIAASFKSGDRGVLTAMGEALHRLTQETPHQRVAVALALLSESQPNRESVRLILEAAGRVVQNASAEGIGQSLEQFVAHKQKMMNQENVEPMVQMSTQRLAPAQTTLLAERFNQLVLE